MLTILLPLAASLGLVGNRLGAVNLAPCHLTPGAICSRTAISPLMLDTGATVKLVTCSRCKASFEVDEADFSTGKQVRCGGTGCDHQWFQTADRLQTVPRDMELVDYPQEMKDRIAAGKSAEPIGRYRCFVGNLPFSATEDDLRELFERYGAVASVIIMTDDDGRPRGFGFVNMESTVAGSTAVTELDGSELQGRTITVNEGKQNERGRGGRGGFD